MIHRMKGYHLIYRNQANAIGNGFLQTKQVLSVPFRNVASCFIMIVIQFVTSYSLKCDSNKTEEKKKTADKQTSVLI